MNPEHINKTINNMKRFYALCIAAGIASLCHVNATAPTADTNGVAYADKHVRFTIVAPGLVRMEYSPNGKFVDEPSLMAVNRNYTATRMPQHEMRGDTVVISTDKMTLRYIKNSGPFSARNLSISSGHGMKSFIWRPGMKQKLNLGGTTLTLDRWDGRDLQVKQEDGSWKSEPQQLENGLLARDGWTLIDDSRNYLFDNDPDWQWVKERKTPKGQQDWYFLSYGNDYKGALSDFTRLAGKIALPPRYAFGYWWSRWWAYSEHELRQLVNDFENYNIPLEVLVIDMDWHYTDEAHGGWTGWTWNRRLFPEPEHFLNFLRDKNKRVTLNLHPASGVKKFEAAYPEIARDNGIDPKTEKEIPWISSDKRFIKSMFKHILRPMEKEGVSFWWLDWQQDLYDSRLDSLNNVFWLNYTFFTDAEKNRPGRPMLYHRWGGLGNHRYQIGFSGDNYVTWKSLDFLPEFTATASNVLYGFWSHDLGGHYMAPGDTAINPELYVRSMQFGTYAPIMRTHSNKNAKLTKEPWNFDRKTMTMIGDAIRRRYEIAPYIYTMARKAHDSGISLIRPMYYDHPDAEQAYSMKNQYMFGDNMLVAPVTRPGTDNYASMRIWLPDGTWYENATGTLLEGGRMLERDFALDEVPVYIKAGSILPFHANSESNLRTNDKAYCLNVFPGGDGEFIIYEDNGDDKDYDKAYATTKVASRRSANKLTVEISPRKGSYPDMPAEREYAVKVLAAEPPQSVTVDGVNSGFTYLPEELAVVVKLPIMAADKFRKVEMTFAPDAIDLADGTLGNMRRFVNTFGGLKDKYARLEVTEDFGPMSIIYEALAYNPGNARELISRFRENYKNLTSIIKEQPMSDSARAWFLKAVNMKAE